MLPLCQVLHISFSLTAVEDTSRVSKQHVGDDNNNCTHTVELWVCGHILIKVKLSVKSDLVRFGSHDDSSYCGHEYYYIILYITKILL